MGFRMMWFAMLWWLPLAVAAEIMGPQQLIEETATKVLAEVLANKEEFTLHPERFYPLVETHVLPSFDFTLMSKLVLGKHWKRASEEEKIQFTNGFRQLLVRIYATALLSYAGEKVEFPHVKVAEDATRVNIPTYIISSPGAPPVPLVYSLYLKNAVWKVYDLKIDGVSMVSNYRSSFSGQIRKYKLSGLIRKIDEKNAKSVK